MPKNIDEVFQDVEACISKGRIDSYRQPGDDQRDVIAHYLWHLHLYESLYPSLHALELTLRNKMHAGISDYFEDANWFMRDEIIVYRQHREDVLSTIGQLDSRGKTVAPSNIVATIDFSFWTGLFSANYERSNRPDTGNALWPALIRIVFPTAQGNERSLKSLRAKLTAIRHFRNEVYHYDTRSRSLAEITTLHDQTIELIGWMDPTMKELILSIDRFVQAADPKAKKHINAGLEKYL